MCWNIYTTVTFGIWLGSNLVTSNFLEILKDIMCNMISWNRPQSAILQIFMFVRWAKDSIDHYRINTEHIFSEDTYHHKSLTYDWNLVACQSMTITAIQIQELSQKYKINLTLVLHILRITGTSCQLINEVCWHILTVWVLYGRVLSLISDSTDLNHTCNYHYYCNEFRNTWYSIQYALFTVPNPTPPQPITSTVDVHRRGVYCKMATSVCV